MKTRFSVLIPLMIILLAGCAPSATPLAAEPAPVPAEENGGTILPIIESVTPENSAENPLQLDPSPPPAEMPSTPPVEKFVALSKKDLASRIGVEADRINLVKTAEMLWLNAALGCPRPGQFYAAGRVPGFQIWLEVEGMEYIYNTDMNGTVILCPELNPDVPNIDTGPTPGVPIR